MFHWIITVFFSKSHTSITAFKLKSVLLTLFYNSHYIQNIYHYKLEKKNKQKKKSFYMNEQIGYKSGDTI